MFVSKTSRNRRIRFLQRCWHGLFLLSLTIALISFTFNGETFAQESQPDAAPPAPTSPTAEDPVNGNQTDSAAPSNPDQSAQTDQNADNADEDSDNNASSSDDAADPMEILAAIRKSFAEKEGLDNSEDDLILSQSSVYIYLNRRKVQDTTENILDHWYFSSFEESLNLTSIEFDFITIPPTQVNLDSDLTSPLSFHNNELPVLNNPEIPLYLNHYLNYPIPETVMKVLNESDDETDVKSKSEGSLPNSFSTSNYFVVFLAILGFSILGYMVYRLAVWMFMLDQTEEFEKKNTKDEEVVVPIDMDAFSAYFYQSPQDNEEK